MMTLGKKLSGNFSSRWMRQNQPQFLESDFSQILEKGLFFLKLNVFEISVCHNKLGVGSCFRN